MAIYLAGLKRQLQRGRGDLASLESLLRNNEGSAAPHVFIDSFPNYGVEVAQKQRTGLVALTHAQSGAQISVNAHNTHKEMSHTEMLAVVLRLKREVAKRKED